MRTVLALALALAALSTSAATEAARAQAVLRVTPSYLVVEHGHTLKLGDFSSVDPDCHVIGRAQINLLVAPQGGRVETENGFDYPNFYSNNVRFACDKRKLATTILFYRAAPNFTGTDAFTIESVYPSGATSQCRYTIVVR